MSSSTLIVEPKLKSPIWAGAPSGEEHTSRWHAVYTIPRHEKSLAKQLSLRGIEHFLPLYSEQRKWANGSKVCVDVPLFPGYLFVRINKRGRVKVLQSPGALYIVPGLGSEAAEIPINHIDWLRAGLRENRLQPHPLLNVGQRVRITDGALSGIEGVLQRIKNSCRVIVTLELIMQSVSVEVELSKLEPIQ